MIQKVGIILCLLSCLFVNAQDKSIEQTLTYINNKLLTAKPAEVYVKDKHCYHQESCVNISLSSDGKITIRTKNRIYSKYGNPSDDATYFKTYEFNTTDVWLQYDEGENNFSEFKSSIFIACKDKDKATACIIGGDSGALGGDFDAKYIILGFDDNILGKSIMNAINHIIEKVSTAQKPEKRKDEYNPFASKAQAENDVLKMPPNPPANVIAMVKGENGIYEVPVVLNDVLKISFIFDSGASDVSISPDVALTLIRTGTITQSDFIGTQKYQFADGSTATSNVFILHQIKIGNKTLTNVKASISKSIDAPMLLGQTALQQFGKFTIDNANHTLVIE